MKRKNTMKRKNQNGGNRLPLGNISDTTKDRKFQEYFDIVGRTRRDSVRMDGRRSSVTFSELLPDSRHPELSGVHSKLKDRASKGTSRKVHRREELPLEEEEEDILPEVEDTDTQKVEHTTNPKKVEHTTNPKKVEHTTKTKQVEHTTKTKQNVGNAPVSKFSPQHPGRSKNTKPKGRKRVWWGRGYRRKRRRRRRGKKK